MKNVKITWIVVVTLLLGLFLFSGCDVILKTNNGEPVSGDRVTRYYDYDDFTGVDIGSAIRYEVTQSDNFSVRITAPESAFEYLSVEEMNGVLVIGTDYGKTPWAVFQFNSSPQVVITMPYLDSLDFSGATSGTVRGFSSADALHVEVSGASKLKLEEQEAGTCTFGVSGASNVAVDIRAEDVDFDISGASKVFGDLVTAKLFVEISGASTIDLNGTAADTYIHGSGASRLKLDGLQTEDMDANLSGASNGDVLVSDTLNADLTGASALDYYGDPTLGTIDISNSSKLRKQ